MSSRWIRTRALPLIVWAGTMTGAGLLWQDLRSGSAIGFVQGVEVSVAARQAGRVESLAVAVGQRVRAGSVIATLDARELDAELAVLAAERRRVEAELGAARSEADARTSETTRDLDQSVESALLALKSARAARDTKVAALGALGAQTDALRDLVERRMADRRELDELTVQHTELKSEVASTDSLIDQLVAQVAAARARRVALPGDATVLATEPLRAELAVLERREQLLAVKKLELVLRAPTDGQVAAVRARPGEVVAAGAPLVTLVGAAGDPAGERVLVCLGESQAGRVRLGEAALLYPRGGGGPPLSGHVAALGPHVAELPLRCRRDPQLPEWGREVSVALDDPAALLPGQSFGVAFQGELSPRADLSPQTDVIVEAPAEPAPAAAPAEPAPAELRVPPELAARTRLEPSALAWVPGRDRYVLASDDTGLDKRDEHAPWLFTMDARGALDPAPLVIAGLDAVSDLESIAYVPGDSLYLLASQSRSRKGKRPEARQVFARVALEGAGARLAGRVHLAALLDAAPPELRARLGVEGTGALDLEGMTVTAAGGLLLGLKAPLSAEGRALIWHLPHPERLLAGEGLVAAGLAPWGSAPLTVTADGADAPGGVSELLELDDGSLLIAATASGTDPATQSGALWHAKDRAGLAAPTRVRVFPGLKPEGLARSPGGDAIAVAFDTGDAAPLWMELPWPAR